MATKPRGLGVNGQDITDCDRLRRKLFGPPFSFWPVDEAGVHNYFEYAGMRKLLGLAGVTRGD
jgi:hypothetical protein